MCSLNLALSESYLDGLGVQQAVRGTFRPCPDSCCVVFEPATQTA